MSRDAPHPFTLRQLQYVVAVADELSFRRAAARCHVSQPSLSAQLARLESALGVHLFERSRRRVLLTVAGGDLVARARALLLQADDLVEAARRASDPLAGVVRVGVIPTVAPYLLPLAAASLRRQLRRLAIAWREDKTHALVEALATGTLDAAVVALGGELGDVEAVTLGEDPFLLALPAHHALARKRTPVDAAELRGEEVLLLEEGHCLRDQALEVCSMTRAHEGEFRATSLGTLVQMVAGGAGITFVPALALATEARRARLRVRPMASKRARRTIGLVWRKRSPRETALRQMARVLAEALEKAVPQTSARATPS